jgi:hypothetical protein
MENDVGTYELLHQVRGSISYAIGALARGVIAGDGGAIVATSKLKTARSAIVTAQDEARHGRRVA